MRKRSSFNVIHKRGMVKVDVFVPGTGPLGAAQLERRRELPVAAGLRPMPILGPEDVVLQKLRWYQVGGHVSDRQWRDILSVLRAQRGALDQAYLEGASRSAGLDALLAKAQRELDC